ncbi:MAG: PLDc N-terminal domain-containing protein [Bacteroidota bacterium]
MFSFIGGIIGFIWLIITLGVLYNIWVESKLETSSKLLWTIGIFILPFLGPLGWILFGERTGNMA